MELRSICPKSETPPIMGFETPVVTFTRKEPSPLPPLLNSSAPTSGLLSPGPLSVMIAPTPFTRSSMRNRIVAETGELKNERLTKGPRIRAPRIAATNFLRITLSPFCRCCKDPCVLLESLTPMDRTRRLPPTPL